MLLAHKKTLLSFVLLQGLINGTRSESVLNDRHGELISPATLANSKKILMALLDSNRTIKIDHAVLGDERMYTVPTGRILVAFADTYVLSAIKKVHGFPGAGWNNIVTIAEFENELACIRAAGHAIIVNDERSILLVVSHTYWDYRFGYYTKFTCCSGCRN